MTLRIIAGERRGTLLRTPAGDSTRPTLGRVRTSLFSILMPMLHDARVLDLYAGSGALGLEALSRGAREAWFVESAAAAQAALSANIARLEWQSRAHLIAADVTRYLNHATLPGAPFDLILLDPPYGMQLAHQTLESLAACCHNAKVPPLDANGIIAAQAGRDELLGGEYGALQRTREELYGQTRIAFYRRQP